MNKDIIIKVFKDGDMYCALLDNDPRIKVIGFGITPVDAIRDLCNSIEKEAMEINYEICNH